MMRFHSHTQASRCGRAIQPTPNPTTATASFLYGVSCPAATACTAVGDYAPNSAGRYGTLAERETG
jgi:hypothetical protein